MVRKYVLPVLAIAGLLFAVWMVKQASKPVPPSVPIAEPARSPYPNKISGSGIVEASTRNISIGSHLPGIVSQVFVSVGKRVKAGDPLFVIDDRRQRKELAVREAGFAEAKKRLKRLQESPRPDELPPAYARVKEAEAVLEDLRQQLRMAEDLKNREMISVEEFNRRLYGVQAAEARLEEARADLQLLLAGSWKADIEVALAEVARAEKEVQAARTEIERHTVRAPLEGEVLQVNIRPGEYASSGVIPQPLILMGNLDKLHVRVDIDENDAWRFRPEAPAVASLRGNSQFKTDLTFEYIESFVVPKRSLTGESNERVDTRVMQVIYSFKRGAIPVYPGQLMDVYINDQSTGVPQRPTAQDRGGAK